eukprot:CAMPEP_0169122712 /NCGR_PEP_ID=MMETSP1015-20121227/33381_1 /TAXON_ID=342587 /ORGANISM="Karlodinium micrum, Strain CCMP2283" /LENGTH=91 /DNA_ID=CAMNT_0009185967 /DNA_START=86 /DNA_END=361 /DNA_ORIENTATION=-
MAIAVDLVLLLGQPVQEALELLAVLSAEELAERAAMGTEKDKDMEHSSQPLRFCRCHLRAHRDLDDALPAAVDHARRCKELLVMVPGHGLR